MSKIKIVFAPDALDNFTGTQEELDEFISELTKMIEDSEFAEDLDEVKEVYVHSLDLDPSTESEMQNQSRRLH